MSLFNLRRQMDDLMNQMMYSNFPSSWDPSVDVFSVPLIESSSVGSSSNVPLSSSSSSCSSSELSPPSTGQLQQQQSGGGWKGAGLVKCDVHESKSNFHVTAEIPGINKENVKVSVEDGLLTISGEKSEVKHDEKEEGGRRVRRSERKYGEFSRSFRLPSECDQSKVKAAFTNGVLQLDIPKAEVPEKQKQFIQIE